MAARRVLLTHFSQRYPKMPNLAGLDGIEVGLEDAEEGDGEGVVADLDADVPMVDVPSVSAVGGVAPSSDLDGETATVNARGPVRDMKVGVAFDYMRVKVGEIAHLEKFWPALSRLLEGGKVDDNSASGTDGEDKEKEGKGKEGKRKER